AGAGINIAQRVMDCGDAGHILVSKRVADDLAQYRRWQAYLHDLGDCEVKHGMTVSVVNLYADVLGNPNPPERFKHVKPTGQPTAAIAATKRTGVPWHEIVIALLLLATLIAGVVLFIHRPRTPEAAATQPPLPAKS